MDSTAHSTFERLTKLGLRRPYDMVYPLVTEL